MNRDRLSLSAFDKGFPTFREQHTDAGLGRNVTLAVTLESSGRHFSGLVMRPDGRLAGAFSTPGNTRSLPRRLRRCRCRTLCGALLFVDDPPHLRGEALVLHEVGGMPPGGFVEARQQLP